MTVSRSRAGRLRHHTGRAYALTITPSGRRIGDAAAESAFFLAVAILPMMLTTTAVLRALRPLLGRDAGPDVERGLARLLRIVLTPSGGAAADAAERLLTETAGGLLTVGTVASIVLLTRAMRSILTGLDTVATPAGGGVPVGNLRRWAQAAALAALGVVLVAVIMAMVAIGPLLGHSGDLDSDVSRPIQLTWVILRFPVGAAVIFGFLLLIHTVGARGPGPERRPHGRRAALVGGAASTFGVVAASFVLPLYVHVLSSVSPTLGALGGGLILLIWAYLLVFSILLGAQLRARIAAERAS